MRQSEVTHGSPTIRPYTYVRLRRRYHAAHPPSGANVTPLPPPRPWWLVLLPAASQSRQGARAQAPPPPPEGLSPASQRRLHPPPSPAPRPLNPSTTPRSYPPVRSPPPTTYRAVSCATSRTASFAATTPPPPRTGHTHGAALSSSQARAQHHAGSWFTPLATARFSHCTPRSQHIPLVSAVPDLGPLLRVQNFEEQKHRLERLRGRFHQRHAQFLTRGGHMQHASSFSARLKHRSPVSSHLNEKKAFLHVVGPHKCPTYGQSAKTHAKIRCRVTLLTMSDSTSPYGDVRLSRTRSLRGHPAFSQVLPQRALGRKKLRMGAPMRMLDSTLS